MMISPEALLEDELRKEKPDQLVIDMLLAEIYSDDVPAEDMITECKRMGGVEVYPTDN